MKGYKNIMKLPDCFSEPEIGIKSKKCYQTSWINLSILLFFHPSENIIKPLRVRLLRMAIYVMLGNLKHAAFENLGSIEERDKKAAKIIESLGGKLHSLYYTIGQYDFVAILDLPSKEALVKFLAIVGKFGTVRSETLETIPTGMLYAIARET